VAELTAESDFAGEEARALSIYGCYPMSTVDFQSPVTPRS